jgi:hypothetical protein
MIFKPRWEIYEISTGKAYEPITDMVRTKYISLDRATIIADSLNWSRYSRYILSEGKDPIALEAEDKHYVYEYYGTRRIKD